MTTTDPKADQKADPNLHRGFATRAVHAGQGPDPLTGAVIPPIYQTSTFTQPAVESLHYGYEYSRGGNPTRTGLEAQLASLEGGTQAFAFASGIAAEDALLRAVLRPGDRIIACGEGYGGTHRLLSRIYARWQVETIFVPAGGTQDLEQALQGERSAHAVGASGRAAVVWVETPTNPLLTAVDIAAWAQAAHAHGALLVVDNTFASPALQTPLAWGADAVVHSTTKYIGGHSDVLGGAVFVGEAVWEGEPLAELLRFQQFAGGAVPGPQDCFLASRGVKTLGVRMRQHCANAQVVAQWLEGHPAVRRVYYPGLSTHPSHAIAAQQMSGFGGVVTFQVRGGEGEARRVAESTRTFALSVSLGGVESLVSHPITMTHGSTRGTSQAPPADAVRLSLGIEDAEDLLDDLDRALSSG